MARTNVGPRDCVLAIAVPATLAELAADLNSPDRDFAPGLCRQSPGVPPERVFATVLGPSLALLAEVADELRCLGGRVVERVDLPAWHRLFLERAGGPPVTTLLAHGTGAVTELRSGLHSPQLVAAALPPDYAGVVDLTSCHSMGLLADALKARARGATVLCTRQETALSVRLVLYRNVIRRLARRAADYVTTVVDVWTEAAQIAAKRRP